MKPIVIDGKNAIAGRIATTAAKQAIQGTEVAIINCSQIIISGNKKNILKKQRERREKGSPLKGPFYKRRADHFVKRIIRGMLPHKQIKGKEALKRIKCYVGIPEQLKEQKSYPIPKADAKKLRNIHALNVAEICKLTGGKYE